MQAILQCAYGKKKSESSCMFKTIPAYRDIIQQQAVIVNTNNESSMWTTASPGTPLIA